MRSRLIPLINAGKKLCQLTARASSTAVCRKSWPLGHILQNSSLSQVLKFHSSQRHLALYEELMTLRNKRVQNYLNHMLQDAQEAVKASQDGPDVILTSFLKRQIASLFETYKKAEQTIMELEAMREGVFSVSWTAMHKKK